MGDYVIVFYCGKSARRLNKWLNKLHNLPVCTYVAGAMTPLTLTPS